ncbi:MAG: hypothetical protein J4G12_10285 [Gemmatimonadetes bacterium]|nr:hypothetical protein [Gemmatimonadota bacterium]
MARQVVKYQTTSVEAARSAQQICDLARKYGASRFEMRWDDRRRLEGVRFAVRHPEAGEVPVVLRAPEETITRILWDARGPNSRKTRAEIADQAHRIAWRHMKDLTEQLLLATRLGLRTVEGAFMADIEVWDDETGETTTMAELFARRARLEPGQRSVRLLPAARRV